MNFADNPLRPFFETLVESIGTFRSHHKIPEVLMHRFSSTPHFLIDGVLFTFECKGDGAEIVGRFMAVESNVVEFRMKYKELAYFHGHPSRQFEFKEYIEDLLEGINAGIKQMREDHKIVVPTFNTNPLAGSIQRHIAGTVH